MDEKKEVSKEQAADLAAIEAAIQNQPNQSPVSTSEAAGQHVDLATEFTGMIKLAVAALSPAFPSLAEIYTEQITGAAAATAAALCQKHQWLQDGIGGKWAEEIAAAAILMPLAYQTYQGINADLAKAKKKSPGQETDTESEAEPVSAQKTVTFGAAVDLELQPA